jgi:hypothetical protein
MVALRMDGTVRPKRAKKVKRATAELPFWVELAFVNAYKDGLSVSQGKRSTRLSFDAMTPWYEIAGYEAGRLGMDNKQAFVALQDVSAKHGFHRD